MKSIQLSSERIGNLQFAIHTNAELPIATNAELPIATTIIGGNAQAREFFDELLKVRGVEFITHSSRYQIHFQIGKHFCWETEVRPAVEAVIHRCAQQELATEADVKRMLDNIPDEPLPPPSLGQLGDLLNVRRIDRIDFGDATFAAVPFDETIKRIRDEKRREDDDE